eukprot:TRINITY_DN2712_c0_g1_i4.p1 TRINITY_DN2712_c0_g1~~TRINITY_DN2712_c0_g1_i4.p1  ORF type:complete len:161 (-),score=12.07 TRINITY_DN2712_c0_g1_i4:4-486(-)
MLMYGARCDGDRSSSAVGVSGVCAKLRYTVWPSSLEKAVPHVRCRSHLSCTCRVSGLVTSTACLAAHAIYPLKLAVLAPAVARAAQSGLQGRRHGRCGGRHAAIAGAQGAVCETGQEQQIGLSFFSHRAYRAQGRDWRAQSAAHRLSGGAIINSTFACAV